MGALRFMTLTKEQLEPSQRDISVLKAFRTCLKMDGLTKYSDDLFGFSSDTYRLYQFDKVVAQGLWFAKMSMLGIIRKVGVTRTQFKEGRGREIRVWSWTGKKLIQE